MLCFRTVIVFSFLWWLSFPCSLYAKYLVGVGKADITGPAAGSAMMGYAKSSQISAGINDKQWARAFIVVEPNANQRVAIVIIDAGAVFNSVLRAVEVRLSNLYGSLYTDQNILVSATHTHSAVAGQSHHFLYNMPSGVFDDLAFERMVNGIVQAVSLAHESTTEGELYYNYGVLTDTNINRSSPAYIANNDKNLFPTQTDQTIQQIKFISNERALGAITWFATHAVSFSNENLLLSSDNKSYASWLFEQHAKRHWKINDFVAAFPQSSSGDMSPNIDIVKGKPSYYPERNVRTTGRRLFKKSLDLFLESAEPVKGSILSGQRYIDFSRLLIIPKYSGESHPVQSCSPAMGYAFAAGTEDGRSEAYIRNWLGTYEGQRTSTWLALVPTHVLTSPVPSTLDCQTPKPVLIDLGSKRNYSLLNHYLPLGNLPKDAINFPCVPKVIPIFYAKLGSVQLAGLPVEPTIMAGHRLKSAVSSKTDLPESKIIIAGYFNDYASYLTTPEEYDQQHYEGASTLYSRYTLAGFEQELSTLVNKVKHNLPIRSHREDQLNLSFLYESLHIEPFYEDEADDFGWLEKDTEPEYRSGRLLMRSSGHLTHELASTCPALFMCKK